jgi:hypothetical protein
LEKEGQVRAVAVQFLEQNAITVSQLITDRHLQVAKWVREKMSDPTHYVDVLHVAKGIMILRSFFFHCSAIRINNIQWNLKIYKFR